MKTYNNLYSEIISLKNLVLAWKKAKKGKTKKDYVIEFEKNLPFHLKSLHKELVSQSYYPLPLQTFVLRDPKTRKISKSDFRDRIVHHALCNIIEPIFDKTFIQDNCASRKKKGNLFAIQRFYFFLRKISKNNSRNCFILKGDIKHYFEEINYEILLEILNRKIKCEKTIWLVKQILQNKVVGERERERERDGKLSNNFDSEKQVHVLKETQSSSLITKGMPLGNLTSQFFANIYLNELDQFVKQRLKAKYYIRYVDDFVILHTSKKQLTIWKKEINNFLNKSLKLELHTDKSRIINISESVDFVGFRNFYYHKLLRKRNIKNMERKINLFNKEEIDYKKLFNSFIGWNGYAKWSNSHNLFKKLIRKIKPN